MNEGVSISRQSPDVSIRPPLYPPGERPVEGEAVLGDAEGGGAEVLELLVEEEVEGGEGPEGEERRPVALGWFGMRAVGRSSIRGRGLLGNHHRHRKGKQGLLFAPVNNPPTHPVDAPYALGGHDGAHGVPRPGVHGQGPRDLLPRQEAALDLQPLLDHVHGHVHQAAAEEA